MESITRLAWSAPVSSPFPQLNALRTSCIGVCLASAIWLGSGALALADPAGSEYLPKVPDAKGHASGGGSGQSGASGTSATGSSSSTVAPSVGSAESAKASGSKEKKGNGKTDTSTTVSPASSTDDGSSGGGSSGLWVVLLIVAGVIVTAVGMTLRRRQGGEDGPQGKPDAGKTATGADPGDKTEGGAPNTPRTPDGEIIASRDPGA